MALRNLIWSDVGISNTNRWVKNRRDREAGKTLDNLFLNPPIIPSEATSPKKPIKSR